MNQPAQPIQIVSFPVEGMTRASSVNQIARLGTVEGVEGAQAAAAVAVTVVSNALRLRRITPPTAASQRPATGGRSVARPA